jgi:hypothetical protein
MTSFHSTTTKRSSWRMRLPKSLDEDKQLELYDCSQRMTAYEELEARESEGYDDDDDDGYHGPYYYY